MMNSQALKRVAAGQIAKVAVAAALLGTSAGALADEYGVSYSRAELATQQGVETVHARIVRAAQNYCPLYKRTNSISDHRACVAEVVADLVEKVDHAALTDLHQGDDGLRVARATDTDRKRG